MVVVERRVKHSLGVNFRRTFARKMTSAGSVAPWTFDEVELDRADMPVLAHSRAFLSFESVTSFGT